MNRTDKIFVAIFLLLGLLILVDAGGIGYILIKDLTHLR